MRRHIFHPNCKCSESLRNNNWIPVVVTGSSRRSASPLCIYSMMKNAFPYIRPSSLQGSGSLHPGALSLPLCPSLPTPSSLSLSPFPSLPFFSPSLPFPYSPLLPPSSHTLWMVTYTQDAHDERMIGRHRAIHHFSCFSSYSLRLIAAENVEILDSQVAER
jgi:hypothetical protein